MAFSRLMVAAVAVCITVTLLGGWSVASRRTSAPTATRQVLWRDPGDIRSLDLSWADHVRYKPPAPPYTFVKEVTSGTRAKVKVKDADGETWNVKLAGDWNDTAEGHAEVAAGRIVWALGYFSNNAYYVPGGTIDDVGEIHRAARGLTPDGRFRGASFKERERDDKWVDHWTFTDNPFVGTRELSGLMILMTMINNWDLNRDNSGVASETADDGTQERRYLVTDLGASFGHMENVRFPWSLVSMYPWTKWNLRDYQRQRFIDSVHDGRLRLHFRGDTALPEIPLEHARWFAGLVSQLTPQQIRQAFDAADATPEETTGFSARFEEKVRELVSAVSESSQPR